MLAALSLLALHLQTQTFDLYRGAAIAVPRYWDVSDTFLDSSDPDSVNGGSYTLVAGKGKTILIRFGDLNRILGPHKHVVRAALFFTPSGGEVPVLKSVSRLSVPWGEGPRTVIANLFMPSPTPTKPGAKPEGPKWAASYRQRRTGFAGWQGAGASGAEDAIPLSGAHLESVGKEFSIEGLEGAVQKMLDDPTENFGFSVAFTSESEFFSSKSPNGRPRLEVECADVPAPTGPDLTVTYISRSLPDAKNGGDVDYEAHLKNVGDAPAKPFSVRWRIGERFEKPIDVTEALAPGGETTVPLHRKLELTPDERTHPLGLRIIPNGDDACTANKELDIDENAMPVNVVIGPGAATRTNMLGSNCAENWIQQQVTLWNDTYAAQSRFSFAPEGALSRIRVNSIITSGEGIAVDAPADPLTADLGFIRKLAESQGLLDGAMLAVPPGCVHVPGSTDRSDADYYPGLMGYGDTRFEGSIPGAIPLSYGPVSDATLDHLYLETTDLLSATDVAALNRHLGQPLGPPADDLLPIKNAVILRALSFDGRPLANTDLLFFQSSKGAFPPGDPAFAVKTNDSGLAVINGRGTAGPYGQLDPDAGNGVFLIQAKLNGVLETGWLKSWQLNEAAVRGATTTEVRLNLPDLPLDTSVNLASDRIVTDSANDLPAKLAGLIDDSVDSEVAVPDAPNSWVEIDLGRDRAVGEIDLITKSAPFWQKFDIMAYTTGQTAAEASPWVSERDWKWTVANRSDASGGARVVAYRGGGQRFRYLRIVNRSGGPGSLAEIRVFGARVSGQ